MSGGQTGAPKNAIPQPIGRFEFPHRVNKGESISQIAAWYRTLGWPVHGWEPIWRLNETVYSNLRHRGKPSLIYPNDVLIIPRSPEGYDWVIRRLEKLEKEIRDNAKTISSELSQIKGQADTTEKYFNLAGTVLTLTTSLAIKGINLITLTNRAKTATGPLLEKIAYDRSFAAFEFYSELVGGGAELTASVAGAYDAETAINAGKVATGLTVTGKKGLAEVGAKGVKAVISESAGEVLLHALGYLDPGTLARRLVGLDAELQRQDAQSKSMAEQIHRHLREKIIRLSDDRKAVYGTK